MSGILESFGLEHMSVSKLKKLHNTLEMLLNPRLAGLAVVAFSLVSDWFVLLPLWWCINVKITET